MKLGQNDQKCSLKRVPLMILRWNSHLVQLCHIKRTNYGHAWDTNDGIQWIYKQNVWMQYNLWHLCPAFYQSTLCVPVFIFSQTSSSAGNWRITLGLWPWHVWCEVHKQPPKRNPKIFMETMKGWWWLITPQQGLISSEGCIVGVPLDSHHSWELTQTQHNIHGNQPTKSKK